MAPTVEADHTWPIARRVRAPPIRHPREHMLCRRQPPRLHAVVPFDVAKGDRPRLTAIRQRIIIAEHLPWARRRVAALLQLHTTHTNRPVVTLGDGLGRARAVVLREWRRVMEAPCAVIRGEWIAPIKAGRAVPSHVFLRAVT